MERVEDAQRREYERFGSRETNIDVSIDDFVRVCFGDYDAIYGCCCVWHIVLVVGEMQVMGCVFAEQDICSTCAFACERKEVVLHFICSAP